VTDYPGEHPEPPADLATRDPLISHLTIGITLYRLYARHRQPLFFGRRMTNRFDSPDGKYGVLYAGLDVHCCFVESFGQATGIRLITETELGLRHLAQLDVTRPLNFIDLSSSGGLARIGADARLFSGSHALAQRWSAKLRDHPSRPDGIVYRARHDPARNACAIFDCLPSVFKVVGKGSLIEAYHSMILGEILDCYGFGLIP
jgi:hypothetical protein